ncbi:MAG: ATP-dependent DNA helicase RecG [Lachnospiraceae bacterium]
MDINTVRLTDSVTSIKGVGEKSAVLFRKLDIITIRDLLHSFPRDYEAMESVCSIGQISVANRHVIEGQVVSVAPPQRIKNLLIMKVLVKDDTGAISLTFFNQPYLKASLRVGSRFVFRGLVKQKGNALVMEQPSIYTLATYESLSDTLRAIYTVTKGLTSKFVATCIERAFEKLPLQSDYLPSYIKDSMCLVDLETAYRQIHLPDDLEHALEARRRLVFDELFMFMYMIRKEKGYAQQMSNSFVMKDHKQLINFLQVLPFALTNAQKRTWEEISSDLSSEFVMNRLVQGDVGSGKTILALLALLKTVTNRCQGVLMAPTEVLARQHMESFLEIIDQHDLPFRPVLLVGSMTAREKRNAYEMIASGDANLVIGTHAVIQEKVVFQRLALVVTDEQHRFGVRQREMLANKGAYPHVLVMSATPIPRSLAIILYGDMHLSVVDELPANRLARKNCVVNTSYRPTAYKFIEKEVSNSNQVYIICPMVEAPEDEEDGGTKLESVIEYTNLLKNTLASHIRIAYLHGKMRPKDKNTIMEQFSNKEIDVLVSTTVIEVGINVPNATVMMVENAERFGLAGLHQLRGRVGRGKEQSYCIFVTSKDDKKTMERLEILNKSNDGFFIASEDLRLRGPGDLFGVRQSGDLLFELADIYQDANMLKDCSALIDRILEEDEELLLPENKGLKEYFASGMWNGLNFRTI